MSRRAVALSIALHAALAALVWRAALAFPRVQSAQRVMVLARVTERHFPSVTAPPVPPPPAPFPPPIAPTRPPAQRPRAHEPPPPNAPLPPETRPETPPQPPPPSTNPPPSPSEHHAIALFDAAALSRAAGPDAVAVRPGVRDPGGHLRRAGDGLGDPNARDAALDREEASARVRGWLRDSGAEAQTRQGNVPPAWRDAERTVMTAFHPPDEVVADDDAARGFLKQWMASRPSSQPLARGMRDSNDANDRAMEQMFAGGGKPAEMAWRRCEVIVVVDAEGRIVEVKLGQASGRRQVDRAAIAAVKAALLEHPVRDARGAVRVRFSVGAAISIAPPNNIGLTFDEVTGKISAGYPLQKKVLTDVSLLSVTPVEK